MATITENISNVALAIRTKLDQIPQLRYSCEDRCRDGQEVGLRIVVMHQDCLEFTAGVVSIGSTVLEKRAQARVSHPQVYYDNLMEVKVETFVSPRFMSRWLEHGYTFEPSFRQSKPEAKVRADALADTIAKWAEVLIQVVPEYRIEAESRQAAEAKMEQERAEARRLAKIKADLEQARADAQERLCDQAREELVRDYNDILYAGLANNYYGEDPVLRAQRNRIQSVAGFQITVGSRLGRDSGEDVEDIRPWVSLDGSYCQSFSMGEVRAMLDALKQYRAATPSEEWLPQSSGDQDLALVEGESESPEEECVPTELSASILLGVPLPESMDD